MSQITVMTGPERRRRWSEADKAAILSEAFSPGGNVTEVARRYDVSTGLVYTWRAKARAISDTGFAEVFVADHAEAEEPGRSTVIRIELAAARVSVGSGASPALVGAVLKALR